MGNDETGISQIQKSLWAGNDRGSAPGCNGRVRHGEGCGYGGGSGFGEQGGRRDLCVGRRSGGNGGDPIGAIWGAVGYTVLLCFMLFKTGTISKSIFNAR